MAELIDDRKRQVVPRWRPFAVAMRLGEVAPVVRARTAMVPPPSRGELEGLFAAWRSRQSAATASALIDAAIVQHDCSIGFEAAEWLLANAEGSSVTQELAKMVRSGFLRAPDEGPLIIASSQRHVRIATWRRRLRLAPGDSMLWMDLAREYTILGQHRSAEHAVRIAIALNGHDRFIARSACRFFLHAGDPERAHQLLLRTPSLVKDPWLLSAELAAAGTMERDSRLVPHARRLIESQSHSPRSVSELASALATMERDSGNLRIARKLFRTALTDPTENAVAQVSWAARHDTSLALPELAFETPRAYEARAWHAVERSEFEKAVTLADTWLRDEPFASRPALFGAWTASVALGDHERSLRILREGAHANRADPRLMVSRFYSEASSGRLAEASASLAELEQHDSAPGYSPAEWQVLLEADRGLLAFRSGNQERGTQHYERAIGIAAEGGFRSMGALAYLHYLMEVVRVAPTTAIEDSELDRALDLLPMSSRTVMTAFVGRIRGLRSLSNPQHG